MDSNRLTVTVNRAGLMLKKYSPDILFGLGVTGIVGAAVMAANASRSFDSTKAQFDDYLAAARDQFDIDMQQYDDPVSAKKHLGESYIRAVAVWVKLYGPAVGLGLTSIGLLATGHIQSRQRIATSLAAYAALDQAYRQYRERVIEKYGEDTDDEFRFGKPEKRSFKVTGKDGKQKTEKFEVYTDVSETSAFFDEYSLQWRNDSALNKFFLKSEQSYFNDRLNTVGHVFLNEVWDALGIPRTSTGALVGWVRSHDKENVIDFGIFSTKNSAFTNGHESACLITPNVDGVIYDLL